MRIIVDQTREKLVSQNWGHILKCMGYLFGKISVYMLENSETFVYELLGIVIFFDLQKCLSYIYIHLPQLKIRTRTMYKQNP